MNRTAAMSGTALALLLLLAASTLAAPGRGEPRQPAAPAASHQPQGDDDGPPSAELLDRVVKRLGDADIQADVQLVSALATEYGVGGAVRILAWADATGMAPADIGAMFDAGQGWGAIARQLNEEDPERELRPGIGSIMGRGNAGGQGVGLGRGNAPGQLKKP